MRVALLSDIHSNLEALLEVEKQIKKYSLDKVICLGDIAGYAARPCECIDLVIANGWQVIAGNHDWASAGKIDITYFNHYAKEAILWTRQRLKPEHRVYLANLPISYKEPDFTCVHSSLFESERFHYLDNYPSIYNDFSILRGMDLKVCFVAHTHIPSIFIYKADNLYRDYSQEVKLSRQYYYIINIGSVGQPRDRDPRSCFCIFDGEKSTAEFVRIKYNIKRTQEEIRNEDLPSMLADRIEAGW